MESPMLSIAVTKSDKYVRLQTRNYQYHPSIINGIQRMMLNFQQNYIFDMYLDIEDYEFLATTLKIPRLNSKHQKFSTLSCNTKFPIPMLSLHMSRQALNSEVLDYDGNNILHTDDNRKIYFALCARESEEEDPVARIGKPRVNHASAPEIIYARDMQPFVFTRATDKDPWTYNDVQTEIAKSRISEIFRYNGKMALIEHGKHISAIFKPILSVGKDDPAASPCRSAYRWVMNPFFSKSHPIVYHDFTLRRKIEGQPGAKDMFLMHPSDKEGIYGKMEYHDKFGTPYGLDLMFQYNGKRAPDTSMQAAVQTFKQNLELLQGELIKEKSEVVHTEDGKEGWSTLVTIPMNVDVNLVTYDSGKYKVLLDDGLHHAVSVKVLKLLDGIYSDRLSLWENTAVYYKVPHRLISQIVLFVKLPEDPELDTHIRDKFKEFALPSASASLILINAAINEVITDLNAISVALLNA
jgi:hypothetical protein